MCFWENCHLTEELLHLTALPMIISLKELGFEKIFHTLSDKR